jgi:MFS family permease
MTPAGLILAVQFLVALDGTLISVALPPVARHFGLSLAELAWVPNVYALALGVSLVLAGRAADLWTPQALFAVGALGFGTGALFAAVAPTALWLTVARGLQGIAAAVIFPSGLAMLAARAPDAIGHWGAATALAAPVGAVAGGFMIELGGWRSTLLVGVPAAAAFWMIDRTPARGAATSLSAVHVRPLGGAGAIAFVGGAALLAMAFFANQYLQRVLAIEPWAAGLAFAPVGVAFAATAPAVVGLSRRWGARAVIASGFVLGAAALLWLSAAGDRGSYGRDVLAPLVLTGVGLAFAFVGVCVAALGAAAPRERGLAGGVVNGGWQLGGVLGLALAVAVAPTAAAVGDAFRLQAGIAVAAAVLTLAIVPAQERDGRVLRLTLRRSPRRRGR